MTKKLFGLIVVVCLFPSVSFGQPESGVIFIPSAVLAFQPEDLTYRSPYLEDHLGGVAWGGSLSLLREHRNFVFGGEINHAFHSKEMSGRLVSSLDADRSPIPRQVSFHETFALGLLGYSDDGRNFQAIAGVGTTLGQPQFGGSRRERAVNHWPILTGGFNFFVPSSARIRFAFGLRYFYVFGGDSYTYVGLDKSAFRGSLGIAFGSAR